MWAVAGLRSSGAVDDVVVAVPAGRTDEAVRLLGSTATVVTGGADRTASVRLALDAVGTADFVLVHDAARPLTPPGLITRIVDALRTGHTAVVPGLPPADTIKTVGADGVVLGTPERAGLRAVQTPQGFVAEVPGPAAYQRAGASRSTTLFTDDASMIESSGGQVTGGGRGPDGVQDHHTDDLLLAKALLNAR